MSAKTIFTKNVNPVTKKTILEFNKIIVNTNTNTNENDLYKKLSNFTILLNQLLILFSEGKFSQVALILTDTEYELLAKELASLSRSNLIYEQIRITIARSLEGLYQGMLQYIHLINVQQKLIKEKMEKMKKMRDFCILPEQSLTIIAAKLRPEYQEYITRYGYPQDGVFEIDKLSQFLK